MLDEITCFFIFLCQLFPGGQLLQGDLRGVQTCQYPYWKIKLSNVWNTKMLIFL